MPKVMVFGTFDIIHPGHLNFLRQAKRYGKLIVIISRDETVKELKGRAPIHNENQRLKKIRKLDIAEQVILGSIKSKYELIKKIKPDVICLGYDQRYFIDRLKEKLKDFNLKTKIVRLKPYKEGIYKSSRFLKQKN